MATVLVNGARAQWRARKASVPLPSTKTIQGVAWRAGKKPKTPWPRLSGCIAAPASTGAARCVAKEVFMNELFEGISAADAT